MNMRFWKDVYVAAVRSGRSNPQSMADEAVKHLAEITKGDGLKLATTIGDLKVGEVFCHADSRFRLLGPSSMSDMHMFALDLETHKTVTLSCEITVARE